MDLDEFVAVIAGDRGVHDLVDHDVGDAERDVLRGQGYRLQSAPFGRAIRKTSARNTVLLGAEAHGIQHAGLIRAEEEHGLARGVESEAHPRLVHGQEASRRQDRAVRDAIAVGPRVVRENASAQVDRLVAVVVELDEIELGKIRVGEDLVDQDAGRGIH